MATEQQAQDAISKLEAMIDAAKNRNQAGEDAVVVAAAAPELLRALHIIRAALSIRLHDGDPSAVAALNRAGEAISAAAGNLPEECANCGRPIKAKPMFRPLCDDCNDIGWGETLS